MVGGYWHPLHGKAPAGAIAGDAEAFAENVPAAVFQSILSGHGVEGYWTAGGSDWLVLAVQQRWPEWAGRPIQ